MKLRVLLRDVFVLDTESHITFPAFLILSDNSHPSPHDSLQAVTEYVSGAGLTWQGCLDWPGEVTDNTTEMSRTRGSFLSVCDGKGQVGPMQQCQKAWLREAAVRPMCLWQGLERKQGFGRQEDFLKSLVCLTLAFVNLSVIVNLSEIPKSFTPGICLRDFVLRWAEWSPDEGDRRGPRRQECRCLCLGRPGWRNQLDGLWQEKERGGRLLGEGRWLWRGEWHGSPWCVLSCFGL